MPTIEPEGLDIKDEKILLRGGQLVPVVGVVETETKEDLHRSTLAVLGKTMTQEERLKLLDQQIDEEQKKNDLKNLKAGLLTSGMKVKIGWVTIGVVIALIIAKLAGISLPF